MKKNSKTLSLMSKQERDTTCAICLESVTKEVKTSLDCCDHIYCNECIKKWVTDVENSCPQCKRSVKQLISKDNNGNEVKENVADRN